MKILDKYIIRFFIEIFTLISIFLLLISIIIDLSQRLNRIYENNGSIKEALLFYYPQWAIWLFTTFMPIIVFITIIIFTSILKNRNEILAINCTGISTNRLLIPYLFTSLIILFISIFLNNYLLPIINKSKNKFYYKYMITINKKNKYENNKRVSLIIKDNEYLFIENFNKIKFSGKGFVYQKFKKQKLIHIIISEYIYWNNNIKKYILNNYIERFFIKNKYVSHIGIKKIIFFPIKPEDLLPEEYIAETLNTYQLQNFIKNETTKGRKNINIYLNELYQRYSISISILVLTILSFYISISKNDKNIEMNIIISITLSFLYIFSIEIFKAISINRFQSSLFSVLMPHFIFILIIFLFLLYRNKNI